jgi:chromosome segregation ATPase
MNLFVTTAKFNEVVAERDALTAQLEELQNQVNTITGERDALQSRNDELEGRVNELTSNNENVTAEVATHQARIQELEAENEQLRELPGAETATTRRETETGKPKTTLEAANEFCEQNAGDVNACVNYLNEHFK